MPRLGGRWLPPAAVALALVAAALGRVGASSGGAGHQVSWRSSPASARTVVATSAAAVQLAASDTPAPASAPGPARPAAPAGSALPPPVRTPPWWSGVCDANDHPGSFPLSTWDGLTACAPGPNRGGYDQTVEFFPGAWGEYEWECVELSMRWLYLEYGVHPYPADGGTVVADYSPADGGDLHQVANDGRNVPAPGDVLSLGTPYEEGHTAVVTGVHVVHGDGWVTDIEQNMDGGNGLDTISVVGGVLEPEWGFPVIGWLAAPPPRPAGVAVSLAAWHGGAAPLLGPGVTVLAGAPGRLASVRWAAAHQPAPAGAWPPESLLDILQTRAGVQVVAPLPGS